jgi:hypothetical protein
MRDRDGTLSGLIAGRTKRFSDEVSEALLAAHDPP